MGLPAVLPAVAGCCCCWLLLLLCVAGVFALWAGPLDLIMILLLSYIFQSQWVSPLLLSTGLAASVFIRQHLRHGTQHEQLASFGAGWLSLQARFVSRHTKEETRRNNTTAVVAQLSLHTTLHWVPLVVTYTCGLTSLLTDCEHRVEPPSPAGSGVRTDPSAPTASAACASPCPLLAGAGGGGAVV